MLLTPQELFRRSLLLYKNNLWLLLGYAAWLFVPFAIIIALSYASGHWLITAAAILVGAIELFFAFWISILLTKLTAQLIEGKKVDQKTLHIETTQRLPAYLGVVFLQAVIFLGGLLLFVAPGILFAIWYSLAQPIAVLDNKRGMQALADSKELVRGRFLKVAGRLIAGPLAIGLIYSVVAALIIVIVSSLMHIDPLSVFSAKEAPLWAETIQIIGEVIVLPWVAAYMTMLYLDLKAHPFKKELENTCAVK
jgi:hypothetical protein